MPPLAPSQLSSDFDGGHGAQAMDLDDIRRVQREWVRPRAARAHAGFDIVYVYGSHTYLPTQFLSPVYNHRTDAYGGSLREPCAVLAARRSSWCARRSATTARSRSGSPPTRSRGPGVELAEGLEFIRRADAWSICGMSPSARSPAGSGSTAARRGSSSRATSSSGRGRAREATEKPIVVVGRFTDPDRMAEVVRSGAVDLIGAARPSISDPFLPVKIEEGRYDEIRECIGCNACYSRSIWGRHLGCTQNATAGEEYRRGWHPERFDRARTPTGARSWSAPGPPGMECAIVLAKRGLELVHLVDPGDDIGGCMRWVTRLPGLGEWGRVVDYRRVQLDRLANLECRPGNAARRRGGALDYGADIVVVATGARWSADGLNGMTRTTIPGAEAGLDHVLTPEQVMVDGMRPPGSRVVVVDYEGYFTGAGVAEVLRSEGLEVALVTCFDLVAHYCDQTLEGVRLRGRLHELGITAHRGATVAAIDPEGVTARDEFGAEFRLRPTGSCW